VLPDQQLAVAQYDGTLQRLVLPPPGARQGSVRSTAHFPHPKGTNVHTMSGCEYGLLTSSTQGLVSLFNARSPWQPPTVFQVPASRRIWSSLLTPSSAILGLSDRIQIHAATGGALSPTPLRCLSGPDLPLMSSAYALRLPPPSSVHHPSTLLSAWYDSHLRIHDLRAASQSPVQTFSDPQTWAEGSAMYSAAFVGEHHVAGGGARHGTVSLFDTRFPKSGWSCFSPGGKGSPVYAMEGEGGRLWGVTDKRAFVLGFDGSAAPETNGGVTGGLVQHEARARRVHMVERPEQWRGRNYGFGRQVGRPDPGAGDGKASEGDSAVGYDHHARGGLKLFNSLAVL
jgi:hypothetical protein